MFDLVVDHHGRQAEDLGSRPPVIPVPVGLTNDTDGVMLSHLIALLDTLRPRRLAEQTRVKPIMDLKVILDFGEGGEVAYSCGRKRKVCITGDEI